ncbi:S49 family peptidase [Rickettsiales bacterium LUAb2]
MFNKKNIVNVLILEGVINSGGRKSISFKNLQSKIDKAFAGKKTKAVALLINSPGGAAAQSEIIANYIKQKSTATKIPVISFVEDVAASGGYFIAVAANEVYALAKSSIVGSIGVRYSGFGLEDFITKYSIKRRVHTAGKNKVMLDAFTPEKAEDIEFINQLLQETHTHFKGFIKENKPNITLNEEELFSGKFWLASTAVQYGIIDGIVNDYQEFLKEKFGKKTKINLMRNKKGLLSSLFNMKVDIDETILRNALNDIQLSNGIKAE